MEIWDIYDAHRSRTGKTMRKDDWNMAPDEFHISVLSVLRDDDGLYLITKRREDKEWAAGSWEFPGGAVLCGENPEHAAVRELAEETGIEVCACPPKLLLSYRRDNHERKNNYFLDVYGFRASFCKEDVKVQQEEVAGFKLASAEEIRDLGEAGHFLHYDSIKGIFDGM